MTEHALHFEHDFTYTNAQPLSVRDVVESLQALDRISRRFLPRTINALIDADVVEAQLYVLGFEHGSLTEKVMIKLVFGSEENLDAFLDKVRDGHVRAAFKDVAKNLPKDRIVKAAVIGGAMAALLAVGVGYVLKGDPKPPNITNVFIIGAEAYQKSPEQFAQIVRAAVGNDRKQLAKDTAQFIAPAKADPAGAIVVDGNQSLSIPRSVVEAMPNEYEPEVGESIQLYENVVLEIRATDRDSTDSGWSGIVQGLFKKRVKMELADDVDATSLSRKLTAHADVRVVSRPGKKGQLEPVRIIVERVLPSPKGQ